MKENWKNPFFATLVLFLGMNSLAASKGGGGFDVEFNGSPVLKKVTVELAEELRQLPQIRLEKAPKDWTSDRVAKVIENLQVDSSPQSLAFQNDGRMKILDFSREKGTITALAGFFLYFSYIFEAKEPTQEQINQIKEKLLHEVSHLWGNNDQRAAEFSKRTMFWIDKNVIACGYDDRGAPKNFYYSLSSKQFGYSNQPVNLDTDDNGYPDVGDLATTYTSTFGSHQMTADSISVSVEFLSERIQVKVGRKTGDDAVAYGTLTNLNSLSGKEQTFKVACVIPTVSIAPEDAQ